MIAGTYRSGGMERVLADKTGWLAANGVADVLVVTTDQRGQKPFFEFAPGIRHIDLDINYEENNGGSFIDKLIRYPFKQLRHYRRLSELLREERADIVVSMFCNDAAFLPRINDGSRKVLEIHFSRYKRLQYGRKGLWALADRWRYANDRRVAGRFDRFVVLTNEDRGYWECDGPMRNISVIPNARWLAPLYDRDFTACHYTVLAVGRLDGQKGFDRLIEAWARVRMALTDEECRKWRLRIVGDGAMRGELQRMIDSMRLGDSVMLGGAVSDMAGVYRNADIYAMTSLYEGLPMALLEAQAAGLPIVSMACKCGPRDVVSDGIDGFLVAEGDIDGMASRLRMLMSDAGLRERMGRAAIVSSDRFDRLVIMDKWRRLFEGLL